MAKHGESSGQTNVHVPYSFTFANATDRAAGTGYTLVPADVGKFARQTDTNTIWILTDDSPITWVQVGGGNAISTGTEAGRPASSLDGNLYLPNDGFYIERDNGVAYVPWGPLIPCTYPINGDFTWINQGSAAVDASKGAIYISAPAGGTGKHIRKKAAPALPYTIIVHVIAAHASSSFHAFGLVFRESSTGKLHTLHVQQDGGNIDLYSATYTNPTTFNATYKSLQLPASPRSFKIQDNNTNRIVSWGMDGQNFHTFHTIGRTDFLTGGADEVGFFIASEGSGEPSGATVLSWKELGV